MGNGRIIAVLLGAALVCLVAFSFYSGSVIGGFNNQPSANLDEEAIEQEEPAFIQDILEE